MMKYQLTIASLLAAVTGLDLTPNNINSINVTPNTTCLTKDNEEGFCVVYYLCNDNGTINSDGEGIIDIRAGGSSCPSYLDTCCRLSDVRNSDEPITPKPRPSSEECGWRNPNGIGFTTTGDETGQYAKFGEFPWMVAILQVMPVNEAEMDGMKLNVYIGGGSLIHHRVVLTAAHKVDKENELYRARMGEWDTQTTKEVYPHQEKEVVSIIKHEDFKFRNLRNDIALLILSSDITKAPNVGFACLPSPMYVTPAGTRCFVSGWGKDQFGKAGKYQVILKKVDIPVVDREACNARLRESRLGRYFVLHATFMCAGGEELKDACRGDGGSPLACPVPYEENRYIESGIVAWGIGCGERQIPGVYVNVASLRDWIDQKMLQLGFDTRTYTI